MIEQYIQPLRLATGMRYLQYVVATCCLFLPSFLGNDTLQAQGASDTTGIETAPSRDSAIFRTYPERWRLGVFFGVNLNNYTANNLQGLPGFPSCCPGYEGGSGVGIVAGGLVEYPFTNLFSLGARLYLATYNGALKDEEVTTVDVNGFAETAIFEHRINADIWTVAIEPVAMFNVTPEFSVFAGLRGDYAFKKDFHQQERILSPDDILYENNSQERLTFEGELPDAASFYGSIVAGASYDIEIGEKGEWVVSPEVSFWYGPTPVIANESWKIHGLRLGISGQFLRLVSLEDLILPDIDDSHDSDTPYDDEDELKKKRHGSGSGG